jgi:hypothetical protein
VRLKIWALVALAVLPAVNATFFQKGIVGIDLTKRESSW